jgi:hypothetical protein
MADALKGAFATLSVPSAPFAAPPMP